MSFFIRKNENLAETQQTMILRKDKRWEFIIKIMISVMLIVYLIHRYGINRSIFNNSTDKYWIFSSIAISAILIQFFAAIRWYIFLKGLNIRISLKKIIEINYKSIFLGSFLPSTDGFAFIRAYYAEQSSSMDSGKASGSVLMEKLTGFFITLVTAFIANIFVLTHTFRKALFIIIPLFLIVLASIIVLLVMYRSIKINKVTLFIQNIGRSIKELFKKKVFFKATPLVLFVQFLSYCCIIFLFRAFQVNLPFIIHLSVIPLIYITGLIPLSISGLGIRESAFVFFYGFWVKEASTLISISLLSFIILTIIPAFIGGMIMLSQLIIKYINRVQT